MELTSRQSCVEREEKFIREREKKKEAGRRTLSEKNAKTGAQKKEKLECFPGRVCEEGGGGEGKKEGTNQKECV